MQISEKTVNDFLNPVLTIAKHFVGYGVDNYHSLVYSDDYGTMKIGVSGADIIFELRHGKEWNCIDIAISEMLPEQLEDINFKTTYRLYKRLSFEADDGTIKHRTRLFFNTDKPLTEFVFSGYDDNNRDLDFTLPFNSTEEENFQTSLIYPVPSTDIIDYYSCYHQKVLEVGKNYSTRMSFSELDVPDDALELYLTKLWAFVQVLK